MKGGRFTSNPYAARDGGTPEKPIEHLLEEMSRE